MSEVSGGFHLRQVVAMATIIGSVTSFALGAAPASAAPHGVSAAARTTTPGGTLEGVVSDGSGSNLGGATVHLTSLATGRSASTVTATDGHYSVSAPRLASARDDARDELTVSDPGYFALHRLITVRPGKESSSTLVLAADTGTVHGVVETAAGEPIAGAAVDVVGFATGATESTLSGSDGTFTLTTPVLPTTTSSTEVQLNVRANGYAPSEQLLSAPAGRQSSPRVVLSPAPSSSTATAGQPLAHELAPAVTPTPVPSCPVGADVWTDDEANGLWETSTNWSLGLPIASSYVCIPSGIAGGVSLAGTASVEGILLETGETLTVTSGGLTINGGATASALEGDTTIDSSTTFTMASGSDLLNAAGSLLTNQGTTVEQGTFEQDAGVVATGTNDNPVDLENGSNLVFAGTGAGAFVVEDLTDPSPTINLSGNLSLGQSLTADAMCASDTGGTTTVHAIGSFTNGGTISTSQAGGCGFGSVSFTQPTGDTLTNSGTLSLAGQPNATTADTVSFAGELSNTGTIDVGVAGQPAANMVVVAGGTLTNSGTVNVLNSAAASNSTPSTLQVAASVTGPPAIAGGDLMNATGGTINIQGSLLVQGTFTQDAGVVASGAGDNQVDLENGSSLAFGGTGAGAFVVDDSSTESPTVSLSGNLASGQSLTIDAICTSGAGGTTTVNASGTFTNAGTISTSQASGCGNGSVVFNLPSGDTLSNSGTLSIAGAVNGPTDESIVNNQTFNGDINNTGTINVGVSGRPSGHFVLSTGDTMLNEGQVTVLASSASTDENPSSLIVSAGTTFTNAAGAQVTIQGSLQVQGTFTQDAGVVATSLLDDPVDLENGSSLAFGGTGAGAFVVDDSSTESPTVSLSGNLASGQSLTIDAICTSGAGGTTTVTAAGSFTNAGTISTRQAGGCGTGNVLFKFLSSGTLTNSGTLSIAGAPADVTTDSETFAGDITNTGTLDVGVGGQPAANMVLSAGDSLLNEGQIDVLATGLSLNTETSTLQLSASTSLTNGAGGVVTNQGSLLEQGAFTQDAGVVATGADDNPVDLENGSSLSFGGIGAGAFVIEDLVDVNPTVHLSGNLVSGQSLTADAMCVSSNKGTTTVVAAGSFTNAGTIATSSAGNCAAGSVTFNFTTGGILTNSGTLTVIGAPSAEGSNAQTFNGSIVNNGTFTVAVNAAVTVTGSVTESPSAVLGAEIISSEASDEMLTVDGKLTLAGTLNFITSLVGSSNGAGETFNMFTDGSQSGTFTGATGLGAGGDLAYDPTLGANSLIFTVVSLSTYPLVTDVTPSSGPAGTTVSVYGTSLGGATAVHFGSAAATDLSVVSNTEVTVVVPAGTGIVPVVVTTPNGTTSSLGTRDFTYATTASGSSGTASLTVDVVDSTGAPLAGVFVGLDDAANSNPLGALETDASGSGTLSNLSTGETVEATLDSSIAPYGPAAATVTLVAGANTVTLTSTIEPLVSSDPTTLTPGGDQEAVWPGILPQPGTTITGGALTSPSDLADVQFTLDYTVGDQVLLAGDPTGSQSFCVDGDWSLTLVGPAPATTAFTTSGSGCPPTSGPINVGTALSLTSGTYGGSFTITAPTGATKDGTSDVYLLPVPGTLTNLAPAPGALTAAALLGGSTSIVVGDTGTLNVTLGGQPLPGPVGYHSTYSFDAGGLTVDSNSFPAGWNGDTRDEFDSGAGSFQEGTASVPSAIGSTVLSFVVTCDEPGTWPITFSGDYWLPGSSAGYADSVSGAPTVVCTAPPATSTPTATGVNIDPTTGNVSVTMVGKALGSATSAVLLTGTGAVAATSTSVVPAATIVTAEFGTVAPGLYDLEVLNGSTVITTTTGTPFEVSPALPLFSTQSIDSEGDIPGIATTHVYRVTNEGTVNGVAILAFTFPSYIAAEPTLDLAASPPGTELLLHGATGDDWAEYVAVPMNAGADEDLSWTITLPPSAVFGSTPSVGLGEAVPIVANLAGQYTGMQWTSVSSEMAEAIVDGAMGAGMDGYSAAITAISALSPATALTYTTNLNDRDLAEAINYLSTAVYDSDASQVDQSSGDAQAAPAPATPSDLPAPPAPSATPPTFDGGDQAAGSFGSYSFNTAEAEGADYGVNSALSMSDDGNADEITSPGSSTPTSAVLVGESTAYDDGSVSPVSTMSLSGGSASSKSIALDSTWDASSQSTSLSSWTNNITDTVPVNDDGTTVQIAALPYLSSDNGPSFQAISRAAVAKVIPHEEAVCTCTTLQGTQGPDSTISADVFTGAETGPGLIPHGGGGGSMQTDTSNTAGPGLAQLQSAFNTASGFLPSTTGAILDTAAAAVGLIASAPFWVVVGAIILAWCLGGACQAMWDAAHALSSEDPNNISVDPSGVGTPGWVTAQPLTYLINFQNEPSATAAAQTVTVTAKLDPNLDPSTVTFGDSSFAGTEPSYDPVSGMLTWVMPNIELPADTSPPDGEGYVSFSADPLPGVASGTAISESAQVIFDFNPPIETPTVTNTIDATPPTATVTPLPATEPPGNVTINWTTTSPVGIDQYILLQSEDGGTLEPVAATSNTSVSVSVALHHQYRFAVEVASDDAGLAGTVPTTGQAGFTVMATPGPYSPITPTRICDTRAANPSHLSGDAAQCNGTANVGTTIPANGIRTINVAGEFGVPADASAVVLNVTAVNPAAGGQLIVFPAGATQPVASNLNYSTGEVVPNLVEVGTGTSGEVSIYSLAKADVVVDLEGYVAPTALDGTGSGLYNPLPSPARLCDTRKNNPSHLSGPDAQCNGTNNVGKTLAAGGTRAVQVGGDNTIPPTAIAAVLNVTVVNPGASGFLTVYPEGTMLPTSANVNYTAGQTTGNRVIVPLSTGTTPGQINIYSKAGADIVVDVSGYYTAASGTGSQFSAEPAPVRICDTRSGNPSDLSGSAAQCNGKTIGAAQTLTINASGLAGVPSDAKAVVVNLTGVSPSQLTNLTVFPGPTRPLTSDLNLSAGEVKGNLTVATVSSSGTISIYNNSGSVNVVIDVMGWYS